MSNDEMSGTVTGRMTTDQPLVEELDTRPFREREEELTAPDLMDKGKLMDAIMAVNRQYGREEYVLTIVDHVSLVTLLRGSVELIFLFQNQDPFKNKEQEDLIRQALVRLYTRGWWAFDETSRGMDWKEYVRSARVV